MTLRLIGLALLVGLLSLGALASGCGGKSDNKGGVALTLDQYFQQVSALENNLRVTSNAIDAEMGSAPTLPVLRGGVNKQLAAFEEFTTGLEAIEAPDEVAELHGEIVSGLQGWIKVFSDGNDRLARVSTAPEGNALIGALDSSKLDEAIAACTKLQQAADYKGISVDLACSN
jgi:hypothetical protein